MIHDDQSMRIRDHLQDLEFLKNQKEVMKMSELVAFLLRKIPLHKKKLCRVNKMPEDPIFNKRPFQYSNLIFSIFSEPYILP